MLTLCFIRSQLTDKSRKGVGFVSYNVVPPPHTVICPYYGLEGFQQPKFEGYGPKTSKSVSENISNKVKESPDALLVEELVLDDKLEKKTVFPTGHLQKKDQGFVGSGSKGGKITSKGTLKTGKLDFEDLYFVKELHDGKASIVNTACYVQNRVLVVKPHNKTPYELFRGRTPALSFMRPFGCHVTILNTLDYLGKFDGKSDEGFFVGYLMNSKAFRVYNIRTRKVEENLHIRFLEDKPIIAGDGPKWLFDIDVLTKSMNYVPVVAGTNSNDFVGTEESIGAGHSSKETGSSQDYIFMPLWKDGSLFDSSSKNANNDEPQPLVMLGKKMMVSVLFMIFYCNFLMSRDNVTLEATHADGDETEVDMSNITTTYPVPSTLNTRIYKDHSLDHVIGKTHEDLHTCLFACFLSQVEPKKVIQALTGPSWIEAMQDELLQFKLQKMDVKSASTPMETSKPLLKDAEAEDVDVHLYRSMIGSLMYLTSSRPDIMFAYPKDPPFDLEAYTDSDYASASLDRKSTIEGGQFLGSILISWQCKKQTVVANSTTEAKYMAAASCCRQFWATAKAKTVNGEVQIQALVDGKKVIVTETSVRRALQLKDVEGTECLLNATIFEQLTLMGAKTTGWNEFSSTMASAVICLTNQKFNFSKYIFDNMVMNLEGGVKFLMYPRRKQRKDTKVPQSSGSKESITDETANEEHVPTHSNDPLFSGEDRLQLKELLELCTKLSERVLNLENTKTSQAVEITKLKERVKKLERRNKSRTLGLKRLRKVGRFAQVVSSEDEGLGAQEDAFKHERKIADLDDDAEEVEVEKAVSTTKVTTVSATTTNVDELTLAYTLIEIKVAKPKAVTTTATTTTTAVTRPKTRGVVVQELKRQILIDEEIAQKLQAKLNAELEEEEKLVKQREEDANIAEWDNVQAMIDADYELAIRLQA
ncbi:putative ribonuclease H-like domain-containing protein [Tanacetum coccineum]|uniref:Ribonuclease H-like domain-containing protein n=1 Tax=Tanacetum coccineum TaxID=301880 RepID=A0ABQ5DJE0_9ASTR